jgi:hypothetical protein
MLHAQRPISEGDAHGAGVRRAGGVAAVKEVRVEFDRPFGFFAAHRATGLILAAGWVAEPEPWMPGPEDLALAERVRRSMEQQAGS